MSALTPDEIAEYKRIGGTPATDSGDATPSGDTSRPSSGGIPRGIRNNNPWNLRPGKIMFPGQTGVDPDGFAIFPDQQTGQAAAEQNLVSRQKDHGLTTVAQIIGDQKNGWDPGNAGYGASVARTIGVDPNAPVDVINNPNVRQQMLAAMRTQEVGAGLPAAPADLSDADKAELARLAAADAATPQSGHAVYDEAANVGRNPDGSISFIGKPGGASVVLPDGSISFDISSSSNPAAIAAWLKAHPDDPANHLASLDSGAIKNAGNGTVFSRGLAQGVSAVGSTIDNTLAAGERAIPGMAWADRNLNPFYQDNTAGQQSSMDLVQRLRNDDAYGQNLFYQGGKVGGEIAATAPLMMAGGAGVGSLAGAATEAAPMIAPTVDFLAGQGGGNLFMRGASLAANGALQGAGAGALTSGGSDAPFGQQVATGALAGGVLGPAIPAVGGAVSKMFNSDLSPAVADLADTAVNKYGIPLRTGQIKGAGGNRHALYQDSNDVGRAGTGFAENNAEQWDRFSKGVTGTYGDDSGIMSPANMSAARSRIGAKIGEIAHRNTITDADTVLSNMDAALHDASQYTTEPQMVPLLKLREAIGSVVTPGVDGGPAQISGPAYAKLIAKKGPLDNAMNSPDGSIRTVAADMRDALDEGFESSVSPTDLAEFQNARFQYKNLMTIADIAKKANVEGQISPQLLAGAVNKSFKNRAFSGAGDLGELSQIAHTFMKEAPQSGTAPRLVEILRNAALTGGAAGGGAHIFLDPAQSIGVGLGAAGIGLTKFGIDAARGAIARSPTVRNALINGVDLGPFAGAGALAQPAYIPAGTIGVNRFLAPQNGPETFLPPPPQSNLPPPAAR